MKNTDLHLHSYYSDGELSPAEVVRAAKKKGVKNLALTDHNSIGGNKEAIEEGEKIGVKVIPGIEIVGEEDEVLGYFIDYENEEFQEELVKISQKGNEKTKRRFVELKKKYPEFDWETFETRFAHSKHNHNRGRLFYFVQEELKISLMEAIKIVNEAKIDKHAFADISVIEAIKLIKKYGGIPVLAHPWAEKRMKDLLENEIKFKELVDAGLKGIELDNGDRDERRSEKIINKIKELAEKYNLVLTAGSDFHGPGLKEVTREHDVGDYNCEDKIVEELKQCKS